MKLKLIFAWAISLTLITPVFAGTLTVKGIPGPGQKDRYSIQPCEAKITPDEILIGAGSCTSDYEKNGGQLNMPTTLSGRAYRIYYDGSHKLIFFINKNDTIEIDLKTLTIPIGVYRSADIFADLTEGQEQVKFLRRLWTDKRVYELYWWWCEHYPKTWDVCIPFRNSIENHNPMELEYDPTNRHMGLFAFHNSFGTDYNGRYKERRIGYTDVENGLGRRWIENIHTIWDDKRYDLVLTDVKPGETISLLDGIYGFRLTDDKGMTIDVQLGVIPE